MMIDEKPITEEKTENKANTEVIETENINKKNDDVKERKKININSNFINVFLIIFFIIFCVAFGINSYINSLLNYAKKSETIDIKEAEVHTTIKEQPKAHEVVNIMLAGADNNDESIEGTGSYDEDRSDALKVISLDYTDKEIKMTSLDRDLVVWLPGKTKSFGHFNWAYSYGGPTLAIQTINYNLDLDITKYVSFSFAGFIEVIDKIGGIDIELTKAEAAAFNGAEPTNAVMKDIVAKEGINHLNGYNALMYSKQH